MRILFALPLVAACSACVASPESVEPRHAGLGIAYEIEAGSSGRIGYSLIAADGEEIEGYRTIERFAMCSTFKAALAGLVLESVQNGDIALDDRIAYGPGDVLSYAPVAKANLARGYLTVEELAAAIVTVSDNTAANLLLARLGGPEGLTAALRGWGDDETRLDRNETKLNENAPGDPRDTTTPYAMAGTLRALLFGKVLTRKHKAMLDHWLSTSTPGPARILKGAPPGWQVGHKTGSCGTAYNDIAHLRSDRGKDYILTVYFDRPDLSGEEAEAAIAELTSSVLYGLD